MVEGISMHIKTISFRIFLVELYEVFLERVFLRGKISVLKIIYIMTIFNKTMKVAPFNAQHKKIIIIYLFYYLLSLLNIISIYVHCSCYTDLFWWKIVTLYILNIFIIFVRKAKTIFHNWNVFQILVTMLFQQMKITVLYRNLTYKTSFQLRWALHEQERQVYSGVSPNYF